MLLITGGAYQGKLNYALDITGLEEKVVVDGEFCDFEDAFRGEVIYRFHELVRRLLMNEEDVEEYVKKLIEENPEAIIIVNEVGSGVIPLEPFDRKFRETVGRISCIIARNADEVHRVVCGMGVKIKHA